MYYMKYIFVEIYYIKYIFVAIYYIKYILVSTLKESFEIFECFPSRGLFIIDPSGTVRQVTINDLPVGRSVEETLRLIQAFQFVEKHGEGIIEICLLKILP